MNAQERKALIGQRIEWDTIPDPHRGYYDVRSGIAREIKGRNILIEFGKDHENWEWLPSMRNIRVQPPPVSAV